MKRRSSQATVAGARYLALRKLARERGRPAAELLQLYALEGFLGRLAQSPHRDRLVLKGGVLLAAFDLRRATRDVDFLALGVDNDPGVVGRLITDIAGLPLDDGLVFLLDTVSVSAIRDDDIYPGVRVRLQVHLATAKLRFQADVNVGDPVVPCALDTEIPTLLHQADQRPSVLAYPRAMVVAEKLVTALQRGSANTRWRDFADLHLILDQGGLDEAQVVASIAAAARHRQVPLRPVGETLVGMADVAQARWQTWLKRQALDDTVPRSFEDVVRVLDARTRGWISSAAAAD